MALHNINTIQNQNDLAYIISQSSEQYNYEALANLGQRYSIKGDGIKTNCFTVADILNIDTSKLNDNEYNTSNVKYITKMYIDNKKLYLSLYSLSNLFEPQITEEIKYSLDNAVYTDAPITLNTKINGIDYYKENLLLFLNNIGDQQFFYIASLGCDSDTNTIYELNIEYYNIKTNELVESMKFIDTNENTHNEFDISGNNSPQYYLYHLKNTDGNYIVNEYKIHTQNIDIIYKNFQSFVLSFYNTVILEYYKSYGTLSINDIVQELIQIGFVSTNDSEGIPVIHDPKNNQGYLVEIDNTQLTTILNYIYNQETQMYLFMFEYYCNYVYKSDNNQLKKYILYKIFNKAYYDSASKYVNEIDKAHFELYIPVGYMFDYYANDNDSFYIYSNETPLSIFFTQETLSNNTDYISDLYNTDQSKMMVCHSDEFEKVILYKFNIEYNSRSSLIINNINIEKLYSSPYILDDYWVINDFKSLYRAVGKDAGNPNIMVIYNGGSNDPKVFGTENGIMILSTVDDTIINESMYWEQQVVKVKLFDENFINNYNKLNSTKLLTHYNIVSYLPTPKITSDVSTIINNKLSEKLKNTFVFNLTKLNMNAVPDMEWINGLEGIINEYYGNKNKINYITTLWKYNSDINSFVPVFEPNSNGIGLTFSDLSNVHGISYKMAETLNELANSKSNEFNEIIIENKKSLKNNTLIENGDVITSTTLTHHIYNVEETRNVPHKTRLSNSFDFNNYNNNNILSLTSKYYILDEAYINPERTGATINIAEQYNINSNNTYTKPVYEYILNSNVPTLQLNEILTADIQLLNRVNILTVEKDETTSKIFYSYIGSSIHDKQKNKLHIGTYYLNPTIGTGYLTKVEYTDKYQTQDTLSLDFNSIQLNASYIYTGEAKHISKIHSVDEYTYYLLEGIYTINLNDNSSPLLEERSDSDNQNHGYSVNDTDGNHSITLYGFTPNVNIDNVDAFRITLYDGTNYKEELAIIQTTKFLERIFGKNILNNNILNNNELPKKFNCKQFEIDTQNTLDNTNYLYTDIVRYNLCTNIVYIPYKIEFKYNETTKKIDDCYITFTEDKKTNFDITWYSLTVNSEYNIK